MSFILIIPAIPILWINILHQLSQYFSAWKYRRVSNSLRLIFLSFFYDDRKRLPPKHNKALQIQRNIRCILKVTLTSKYHYPPKVNGLLISSWSWPDVESLIFHIALLWFHCLWYRRVFSWLWNVNMSFVNRNHSTIAKTNVKTFENSTCF